MKFRLNSYQVEYLKKLLQNEYSKTLSEMEDSGFDIMHEQLDGHRQDLNSIHEIEVKLSKNPQI